MNAVIITIGDEILYGQTVDTNSAYMGQELAKLGVRVIEILSVSDQSAHIVDAIERARTKGDLILMTGGLGPTRDDVTKVTLAQYFHCELVPNQEILGLLEAFFSKRGIPMLPAHRNQALMPTACTPLRNNRGTAWGMWFEDKGQVLVSMPGVPNEMKGLMEEQVLPRVKQYFSLPTILHAHIHTAGIGESYIDEKLGNFENELPPNFKLAFLPETGMVKLRLTATGNYEQALQEEMQRQVGKIKAAIDKHIYGFDGATLEGALGNLLSERNAFITTAESCSGGYVASRITSHPGSSKYFNGSVVAYSEDMKTQVLGIPADFIKEKGVVSEAVACEMLKGVCKLFKADYAIATTGYAGPDGGDEENPVGTVWIAVGSPDRIVAKKYNFGSERARHMTLTTINSIEMMRKYLLGLIA
ncbi:MAG: CinA family nicotinamide mononucleotide deamidase-related protein [Chitinophagales bacterium]|nr:CinA family nicotinamide mononucleotide deamidase-related protein [Chitinophagales bacterium]